MATAVSSTATAALSSVTPTATAVRVAPQAGVFEGLNPSVYNPADPFVLFVIQASIVIGLTRLIQWPLAKINEPSVIAEVIAGILLGPSVMGRVPGFTDAIFPTASLPPFRLAANLGLMLFLFLVGLEIDLAYLIRNWRIAAGVATLDMGIPFGLGIALAYGMSRDFSDEPGINSVPFALFALFVGIAIAITAFPVLCRILISLKLLNSNVGVIVLTSGIANDVIGWILLALCVTLVNSGAGVTAVWVLLVTAGFALFLAFLVRPAFLWVLRRTRSLEDGPTQGVVALTIFLVLGASFVTNIIGVHSIFGAFMVGLMCPHQGGFASKLTEKIEDLIATLFVPLFFALSGLNTNLGLLNTGKTWAYVVAITLTAFFSKVLGGSLGARFSGLAWRESITIGTLMSCKGLVELIVLNIGLQAKILSTRTFTMFVVMALVTTFATTPLVTWLYPPWYQRRMDLWRRGKVNLDGSPVEASDNEEYGQGRDIATNLLVYVRADGLYSLINLLSLFTNARARSEEADPTHKSAHTPSHKDLGEKDPASDGPTSLLRIHGCRLVELSERESSIMRVAELESRTRLDPVLRVLGTAAAHSTRDVVISGQVALAPIRSYAETLVTKAASSESQLLLVPWTGTGSLSESSSSPYAREDTGLLSDGEFPSIVQSIFDSARGVVNAAVFVDGSLFGLNTISATDDLEIQPQRSPTRQGPTVDDTAHHITIAEHFPQEGQGPISIYVLFTGNSDDIFGVRLALQFAQSEDVKLTIFDASSLDGPCNPEFAQIRAHLRSPIADRTNFIEKRSESSSVDHSTIKTFAEREKGIQGERFFIVGRGVSSSVAGSQSSPSPGSEPTNNTVGSVASRIIAEIEKTLDTTTHLLLVQAKQHNPEKGKLPS